MPKNIKPSMSKDELDGFDGCIESIQFDDSEALITVNHRFGDDDRTTIYMSEKDCEKIISFLRGNKIYYNSAF